MGEALHFSKFDDRAILCAAGELIEDQRAAVEAHARRCATCAAVLSREISLHKALAARVQPADTLDRSELLLARCRSELFEALDDATAPSKRTWRALGTPWRWGGAVRRPLLFHPGCSAAALLLLS